MLQDSPPPRQFNGNGRKLRGGPRKAGPRFESQRLKTGGRTASEWTCQEKSARHVTELFPSLKLQQYHELFNPCFIYFASVVAHVWNSTAAIQISTPLEANNPRRVCRFRNTWLRAFLTALSREKKRGL